MGNLASKDTGGDDSSIKYLDFIESASERVINASFSGIPITRVTQFIVGWTRAAFDQSRVIAALARCGLLCAASPNRRILAEIAVRMQWLHSLNREDRISALDAMVKNEHELKEKSIAHLKEMGHNVGPDVSDFPDFILNSAGGALKDQARVFLSAAKSIKGQSMGLYYAWREETQYSHASGALAIAYAPATRSRQPTPPLADADLILHAYTLVLILSLIYPLLIEEGVDASAALAILDAFFDIQR